MSRCPRTVGALQNTDTRQCERQLSSNGRQQPGVADIEATLDHVADGRAGDPLTPVTVIVPSHVALLQLRRRLAQRGPFANVRFEVVSRLAELAAASELARSGRRPMARPIGDYAAWLIARESSGALAAVAEIDGYARALRQTIRRLFGRFRDITSSFYDDEDLLVKWCGHVSHSASGVVIACTFTREDPQGMGVACAPPPHQSSHTRRRTDRELERPTSISNASWIRLAGPGPFAAKFAHPRRSTQ